MQNQFKRALFIGAMVVLLSGLCACAGRYTQRPVLPQSVQLGASYFTQVGMYYDKGRYRTTNYAVGMFIPVNTEVRLIEFGDRTLTVQVERTGESILVENVPKFTNWSMAKAFEALFAPEQVSLFQFNARERKNIEQGTIEAGMGKDAVIVARGYPPSHETHSLKRDQWKFWKNRWDTMIVSFKDDRVVDIKD